MQWSDVFIDSLSQYLQCVCGGMREEVTKSDFSFVKVMLPKQSLQSVQGDALNSLSQAL